MVGGQGRRVGLLQFSRVGLCSQRVRWTRPTDSRQRGADGTWLVRTRRAPDAPPFFERYRFTYMPGLTLDQLSYIPKLCLISPYTPFIICSVMEIIKMILQEMQGKNALSIEQRQQVLFSFAIYIIC